jgi:hypothetical protein
MQMRVSKILLLVETLFLVAPIGFLFTLVLPMAFGFLIVPPRHPTMTVLMFAMGAALVAALRVIIAFCRAGVSGLRVIHKAWWALCIGGGLISIVGCVSAVVSRFYDFPAGHLILALRMGIYGVPLMIPFAHVLVEYYFREPHLKS